MHNYPPGAMLHGIIEISQDKIKMMAGIDEYHIKFYVGGQLFKISIGGSTKHTRFGSVHAHLANAVDGLEIFIVADSQLKIGPLLELRHLIEYAMRSFIHSHIKYLTLRDLS